MNNKPTIAVIGTGYVGLTTAVLFAETGLKVYAIDVNKERLEVIRKGRSFFYEEGINPLVKSAVQSGNLIATSSYKDGIAHSDYVFSSVGTPDNPDGSSNLSYVFAAAKQALDYMKPEAIYIQKSTVPVGTGVKIEKMFEESGKSIGYVSNPEFLREGTAIADTLNFDRVVVGSKNQPAAQTVIDLYKLIETSRDKIATKAGIKIDKTYGGQYYLTNRDSAELIKVTANAFLALKISFANSIAKIADKTGADINEVMDVVGADHRIGRAFLNAGRGYGGGCFPKDVSGLISSAAEHEIDLQIMTAAADLNATMPGYIAQKAQTSLGSLTNKRLAVLGLAFKTGTSDARRSPGIALANLLHTQNAKVSVFDPEANHEAKTELRAGIKMAQSIEEAVTDSEAVFVATDWPQFINYDLKKMASLMKGNLFVDAMNAYNVSDAEQAGLQYMGVGR